MSGRVEVTFETGLLAEALGRASAVAPTSGKDVTMYAGIVVEVRLLDKAARIRSTDSMTFYSTWMPVEVNIINGEPGDLIWRLPSNAFSSVINSLPAGQGKTVTFSPEGRQVSMKSGRTAAKFNLIDPDGYPNWDPFEGETLQHVPGLREAMRRVEWATMKGGAGSPPWSGLLVGPDLVLASDRIRVATVKIDTPFTSDHSVPLAVVKTIMAGKAEPEIGVSKEGSQWLARVDEDTQYASSLYSVPWPNVRNIFKVNDHPNAVEFDKDMFLEMAGRALTMSTVKRTSKLDMFVGDESFSVFCADTEMGYLGDSMELPGQATHAITKIRVNPDSFLDMIRSADDKVTMYYRAGFQYVENVRNSENTRNSQLRFALGKDYQVWAMPLTGKGATS